MGDIQHLPGTRLSPEVVLHRTLAKAGKIKAIAIVIQWDDETYDMDWSQMKVSDLCMASTVFHDETMKTLRGEPDGRIFEKPPA